MNAFGVPNIRTDESHVCACWVLKRILRSFGHLLVVFHGPKGNLLVMRLTPSCTRRIEEDCESVIGTYDRRMDFNRLVDDLEHASFRWLPRRVTH